MLPACSAPTGGDIVFFPVLTALNLCSSDAVAFIASIQAVSSGILSPLNWLLNDPSVFNGDIPRVALVPGLVGLGIGIDLIVHVSGIAIYSVYGAFREPPPCATARACS